MAYLHAPALGCPKPIRNQYKADGNWQTYIRDFLNRDCSLQIFPFGLSLSKPRQPFDKLRANGANGHSRFMLIPSLALRPHRQHKHGVDSRHITVQRHVATRGTADDEFAFAVFHESPNQGAVGQDLNGFQSVAHALGRLANLRAAGLRVGSPFARAAR